MHDVVTVCVCMFEEEMRVKESKSHVVKVPTRGENNNQHATPLKPRLLLFFVKKASYHVKAMFTWSRKVWEDEDQGQGVSERANENQGEGERQGQGVNEHRPRANVRHRTFPVEKGKQSSR